MTDYSDLVNYIRAQTEWSSRSLSGGDWFAIDPDAAPFRAALAIETLRTQYAAYRKITKDAIDNLVRERDEARAERDLLRTAFKGQGGTLDVKHEKLVAAEAEVVKLRQELDGVLKMIGDEPLEGK